MGIDMNLVDEQIEGPRMVSIRGNPTGFIQAGETCGGCGRPWAECECLANATVTVSSTDWEYSSRLAPAGRERLALMNETAGGGKSADRNRGMRRCNETSSDWMDQAPDGAPRDNGAITIPHRTVNGVGVVGRLRERAR